MTVQKCCTCYGSIALVLLFLESCSPKALHPVVSSHRSEMYRASIALRDTSLRGPIVIRDQNNSPIGWLTAIGDSVHVDFLHNSHQTVYQRPSLDPVWIILIVLLISIFAIILLLRRS